MLMERRVEAPARPIRATLSCAWCAREVEDVGVELDTQTGGVRLVDTPTLVTRRGRRAVCAHCGGPLLVATWRTVYPDRPAAAA